MTTATHLLTGVYRAVISRVDDPEGIGRVKVVCPAVNGREELAWALPSSPPSGAPAPALGTPVWIIFEHGDPDFPVWLGTWRPSDDDVLGVRRTLTYTTAFLAAGLTEVGTVELGKGFRVLRVQTSAPALVRLYASQADRAADAGRLPSVDPAPGLGLILEVLTVPDLLGFNTSPLIDGASMEAVPSKSIPITVTATNNGPVTVIFTYLRTE